MVIQRFRIVAKQRRVLSEEGGPRQVELASTEEIVEVEADLEGIARRLGQKAVANTGGVSREIGGLVQVRHVTG